MSATHFVHRKVGPELYDLVLSENIFYLVELYLKSYNLLPEIYNDRLY